MTKKAAPGAEFIKGYLLFNFYFITETLSLKEIPKNITQNQSNHELLSLQFGRVKYYSLKHTHKIFFWGWKR